MSEEKKDQKKINLTIKEDKKIGVYTNAVSVSVKDNDVLLDFGYVVPGVKPTTIEIVSRVNMSHKTAEQFMNVLQNSILDFRNKKK